ncbi:MAG: hypothetical protein H7Z42_05260 [Roseiflexaceae bacterium]|nr:hypothetical protein [Roseiflexaceae bacterium]
MGNGEFAVAFCFVEMLHMLKNKCLVPFVAMLLLQGCLVGPEIPEDDFLPAVTSEPLAANVLPMAQTNEPIVITYGDLDVNRFAFEPLIEAFNQANPDIRVQYVEIESIRDDLPRRADTFRASEAPFPTATSISSR